MREKNNDELLLEGGDTAPVIRVGDTVRRHAGPWTQTIDALLVHLRKCGFQYGPEPLGVDDKGREILTYIEGEVGPPPEWMWSDEVLVGVAKLLRLYHEATLGFQPPGKAHWQRPRLHQETVGASEVTFRRRRGRRKIIWQQTNRPGDRTPSVSAGIDGLPSPTPTPFAYAKPWRGWC